MYRFYLNRDDNYSYGRVHPMGSDKFTIEGKQEENEIFYRKTLNNDVTISRRYDKTVYDAILTYYEVNQYRKLYLTIKPECNLSKYEFSGVTTFRKAKVDKDKGEITFKFEINDAYRPFLQNNEVEFNILNVATAGTVKGTIFSVLEFSSSHEGGVDSGGYEVLTNLGGTVAYARERINTITTGVGWYTYTDDDGNSYSVRHWNASHPTIVSNGDVYWELYLDNAQYIPPAGSSIVLQIPVTAQTRILLIKDSYNQSEEYTMQYTSFRILSVVLSYLINQINPNVNYDENDYSLFFNDNGSSLSDADEYTRIVIAQKSDVLYPGGTSATIGNITWQRVMNIYKFMFNAYWYIDSDNNFRLEYFEDLPVTTQGIDITLLKNEFGISYLDGTNNYTFDTPQIPQQEELVFMEAYNVDFAGMPITYDVDAGNETITRYSLQNITTDIQFIQTKPSEISIEGFVVIQIAEVGIITKYYEIVEDTGILSGNTYLNANMSTANLMNKFWRTNRPLKYGYMNGASVQFTNPLKSKIGGQIKFPLCCTELVHENLQKSLHGWGEIIKSSLSLQDGWIALDLRFDDDSEL